MSPFGVGRRFYKRVNERYRDFATVRLGLESTSPMPNGLSRVAPAWRNAPIPPFRPEVRRFEIAIRKAVATEGDTRRLAPRKSGTPAWTLGVAASGHK